MWSASRVLMERTMERLSMLWPSAACARRSACHSGGADRLELAAGGAPGLRSQMSIVEGPAAHPQQDRRAMVFLELGRVVRSAAANDMAGQANAEPPARCLRK